MLQAYEIEQRFSVIEQAIAQASQACSVDRDVPNELRLCIQKLDQQSDQAKAVIQSQDDARIRKLVQDLEMLGDRAKRVCTSGAQVTQHMKTAVQQVHDGLSNLKHQLH